MATPDLNVSVPDEAVEAALAVWFKHMMESLGEPFGDDHRKDMRATLAAAYPSMVAEVEKLREALTCLWVIADDDHPDYPGDHGIDTVLKMVRAALSPEAP